MKYINYNGTRISKLSLGTVQFGLDYGIANLCGQPKQEEVNTIIEYATNNGINCFDTAQAYGNSEYVLGKALENKDEKFVISKLKSDCFKKNVFENISISLNNLKIESLFALLLHDCKLLYEWDNKNSMIVDELISSGKIKYFGVSIYSSEDFEFALKNEKIKVIQMPFNLFDQRAYKKNWFEKSRQNNKLIIIRSVYLQGLLLMDNDRLPSNLVSAKKYFDTIDSFTNELKITRNKLALGFVESIAGNSLILFGCDNIKQATENIKCYNSLKLFNYKIMSEILEEFNDIDETIYNPTKWS